MLPLFYVHTYLGNKIQSFFYTSMTVSECASRNSKVKYRFAYLESRCLEIKYLDLTDFFRDLLACLAPMSRNLSVPSTAEKRVGKKARDR